MLEAEAEEVEAGGGRHDASTVLGQAVGRKCGVAVGEVDEVEVGGKARAPDDSEIIEGYGAVVPKINGVVLNGGDFAGQDDAVCFGEDFGGRCHSRVALFLHSSMNVFSQRGVALDVEDGDVAGESADGDAQDVPGDDGVLAGGQVEGLEARRASEVFADLDAAAAASDDKGVWGLDLGRVSVVGCVKLGDMLGDVGCNGWVLGMRGVACADGDVGSLIGAPGCGDGP